MPNFSFLNEDDNWIMSFTVRISGHCTRVPPPLLDFNASVKITGRNSARFDSCKSTNSRTLHYRFQSCHSSISSDVNGQGVSNADESPGNEGSSAAQENGSRQGASSWSSKDLLKRLQRYGTSGVLAYGLLNTVYYLTTFLFVWFYVAPTPGKMGYLPAVGRFFKIMATVWAGSQVTKLARAGGALALAPFVEKGLSWFTIKFKFESQGKASIAIVGVCFGLALALFFVVTLLWA